MFDSYLRRARFYPAVIAAAPAFALAAILVSWNSIGLSNAIATAAMAILLAVMSDVARRRGRAVEPDIIRRMGGSPSIVMMRYADDTFDSSYKSAIHNFIGSRISAPPPTPESETTDPIEADRFYSRSCDWLREHTRDIKKYGILFEENVTYGFRRNLLGLKWPALVLNITIVVFCLFSNMGSVDTIFRKLVGTEPVDCHYHCNPTCCLLSPIR